MGPIISDSGPIISFARVQSFHILQQVIPQVMIPQAVYIEIAIKGKGKPGSQEIEQGSWSKVITVKNSNEVKALPRILGAGEREAIVLAQELGGIILMDDLYAREEAKRRNIPLVGSLDVIEEAKSLGLIKKGKTLLEKLIRGSFRLSPKLYREFLHRIGEL